MKADKPIKTIVFPYLDFHSFLTFAGIYRDEQCCVSGTNLPTYRYDYPHVGNFRESPQSSWRNACRSQQGFGE